MQELKQQVTGLQLDTDKTSLAMLQQVQSNVCNFYSSLVCHSIFFLGLPPVLFSINLIMLHSVAVFDLFLTGSDGKRWTNWKPQEGTGKGTLCSHEFQCIVHNNALNQRHSCASTWILDL